MIAEADPRADAEASASVHPRATAHESSIAPGAPPHDVDIKQRSTRTLRDWLPGRSRSTQKLVTSAMTDAGGDEAAAARVTADRSAGGDEDKRGIGSTAGVGVGQMDCKVRGAPAALSSFRAKSSCRGSASSLASTSTSDEDSLPKGPIGRRGGKNRRKSLWEISVAQKGPSPQAAQVAHAAPGIKTEGTAKPWEATGQGVRGTARNLHGAAAGAEQLRAICAQVHDRAETPNLLTAQSSGSNLGDAGGAAFDADDGNSEVRDVRRSLARAGEIEESPRRDPPKWPRRSFLAILVAITRPAARASGCVAAVVGRRSTWLFQRTEQLINEEVEAFLIPLLGVTAVLTLIVVVVLVGIFYNMLILSLSALFGIGACRSTSSTSPLHAHAFASVPPLLISLASYARSNGNGRT